VRPGRVPVRGDQDALAARQPVGLDHVRRPELGQRGVRRRFADARPRRGGRDAALGHDLLGECLGALDHRRAGAGPEARDPGLADGIRRPGHERRFRADDDQVGGQLPGQGGDVRRIGHGDRMGRGQLRDARIPGRGVEAGDRRVPGQRPDDGVLPAA
jgi:hypothetical protein